MGFGRSKGVVENKSRVIKQQASLPSNNAHPINEHSNIDTCQKSTLPSHQTCIFSNSSQTLNKPILFKSMVQIETSKRAKEKCLVIKP
jgi:hypothetical protein